MYDELIKVVAVSHKTLAVAVCFLAIPTSQAVTVTTADGGEEDPVLRVLDDGLPTTADQDKACVR